MGSSPTRLKLDPKHPLLRQCPSQKISYLSYSAALDAAEAMMLAGRVDPGCHITPYRCDECSDWHVGNRRIVFVPKGT